MLIRVHKMRRNGCIAVLCCIWMLSMRVGFSLEIEVSGNFPPLSTRESDCPKEVMELVNLPSRVYSVMADGDNHYFYFKGDVNALNDALEKFSAIKNKQHEVLLWPGRGRFNSKTGNQVEYSWSLDVPGGIVRVFEEPDKSMVHKWQACRLKVYPGEINLDHLKVPKEIELVGPAEIRARLILDLESEHKYIRGQAANALAQVAVFYDDVIPKLIAHLGPGEDEYVRQSAAAALGRLGKKARRAIPVLEKGFKDKSVARSFAEAVKDIELEKNVLEAGDGKDLERINRFIRLRKNAVQ